MADLHLHAQEGALLERVIVLTYLTKKTRHSFLQQNRCLKFAEDPAWDHWVILVASKCPREAADVLHIGRKVNLACGCYTAR